MDWRGGWRTTEFWITLTVVVAMLAERFGASAAAPWDVVVAGVAAGLYAISRGLAKRQAAQPEGASAAQLREELARLLAAVRPDGSAGLHAPVAPPAAGSAPGPKFNGQP